MFSLRLIATKEHLLLTSNVIVSLRCAASSVNPQHGFQIREQHKKKLPFRRAVPFSLATNIHATMIDRMRKQPKRFEGSPSHLTSSHKVEKKLNLQEQEEQWMNELELLSQMMKKFKAHSYVKSQNVFTLEEKYRQRISELGLEKSLQVADVFFSHKYRQPNYLTCLLEYVAQTDPSLLPPPHVTHLMFYMFFHGSAPPQLYYRLEDYLYNNLDQFDVNDLGILCLGYFRGNKRIQSHDLLHAISERVLKNFHILEENMLINILKTFRHSGFAKVSFYETLADKLIKSSALERSRSLNSLMHITMTYACAGICCQKLNEELLACFTTLVKKYHGTQNLRSKDLAKFVWAIGTFVYEPNKERPTYEILVNAYREVNREQEKEHPESLADMLQGLTYLGIHPHDLIDRILQPATAKSLKDNAVYGKVFQLLLLHNTVLIECLDYKGRLLSEGFLRSLHQLPGVTGDLGFEMKTRQGLAEIYKTLQCMLGSDKVKVHFILPHFTLADIEMRLDVSGQPISFTLTSVVPPMSRTAASIQTAVTDNLVSSLAQKSSTQRMHSKKVAVEVLGQNQYFANNKQLTGNIQTKLRQLRTLGYHVVLIPPDEASNLSVMSEDDRRHHLHEKLQKEVGLSV